MFRELIPGQLLVSENDELKEFYILLEGTLQHVTVGQPPDIKVRAVA